MKKTLQLLVLTLIVFFEQHTQAQDTIVNIPDANFKAKLLQANTNNSIARDSLDNFIKIDINGDGQIQQSEADRVYMLDVYRYNISSLDGIGAFVNLKYLNCQSNQLTTLDVSKNVNLEELSCSDNQLTTLDMSKNEHLVELFCYENQLMNIDISKNIELKKLICWYNQLTQLDVSKNIKLETLSCGYNQLTQLNVTANVSLADLECKNNRISQLDITKNLYLTILECYDNQLDNLDVSENIYLQKIDCNNNQIEQIDINNNINLKFLICYNNKITKLEITENKMLLGLFCFNNKISVFYIKNGINNSDLINSQNFLFSNNPNLKYICADAEEIVALRQRANSYGYSNLIINSFCSTSSGGTYYTMKSNTRYDANNNGCTAQDSIFPFLKYKINNATDSGYAIADAQGNMSLDLNEGTYTIQPIFSHPYFTVVPAQANVTLPEDTLPTNFCITPIGNINDVTIKIIPTNDARPGFSDATYKIVFTNKGTTTVSGNITFTFQDSIQDFVSSSVVPTSNANGVVTFAYSNLKPFENRSITINLRTNAPTDNPAINGGDILELQAIATMNTTSNVNTSDDTSIIRQTVVNSYDPNDKRCLEGDIVLPELVGDFVNYLIRFENEGTANAINIVVTDRMDTTKFDITSLEVTASSHSNRTLITEGNKVQFIFDNINLPFTEPLKHGFIAFQIKTKNNLVIGDSLKNYADIFFDYNLPITTNTAGSRIDTFTRTGGITSIRSNTNKEGKLRIYPNPSNGNFKINFESKGDFPIHIKLIDLNGRIIKSIEDEHQNQTSIDISESQLSNGLYQISIQTDKDIWQQKVMIVK
jgi:hypothetical protein